MLLLCSTDARLLSNAWLAADQAGGTAVVVDSGAPLAPLLDAIARERLRVAAILTTHRHGDHVAGHRELASRTGAPILALDREAPHVPAAQPLRDGEERRWGALEVRVVALPGHTEGHAGYHVAGLGLFTGDCLFAGSVGGSGAGFAAARASLERVASFPPATRLLPGHAAATTVHAEREGNPFLRVVLGMELEGAGRCVALGRAARLVVLARDYDGGTKAWVRFDDDGQDALVPGSRVRALS